MRSLPLFRFNRRARSTGWGIAFCSMFIVASLSVAGGLRTSMDALTDNFSPGYSLVVLQGPTGPDYFEADQLGSSEGKAAFCIFASAHIQEYGVNATFFSVHDPDGVLSETLATTDADILAGGLLDISGVVTVVAEESVSATVAGEFSSAIFSSSWALGSEDLLRELTGASEATYNFAVADGLTTDEVASLGDAGFSVQAMTGIVDFLDSGVKEIESDAFWVLIPSAFVIAVLAYGYIGAEISDRRHEIGIMKTIGAGRRALLKDILVGALLVTSWGAAIGLALGIVLAYGISTFASSMFTSVFVVKASETVLVLSFLATVAAGVAGSLVPAIRMIFSKPVSDLKEVPPSA